MAGLVPRIELSISQVLLYLATSFLSFNEVHFILNSSARFTLRAMDTKTRIGIQIRELRKAKGLTQDELAALSERSTEAISNLERGISLVGIDTLERLSAKLGVPIRDFFEDAGQPRLSPRRAELLARLSATASGLTDKQLALAVNQVMAIRDNG